MDRPRHNPQFLNPETAYRNCRLVCSEAIITADSRGILSSYNQGAQEILGYLPAEVIGKPLCGLFKDGKEGLLRIKKTLDRSSGVYAFEAMMIGKRQADISVRLSVSLLRDQAGPPYGLIAICHDLSQIRDLQTEIRQKEQFFASVMRNSADAIVTLDTQERITSWNKGAEAIFGYTEEEMLGQSLEILLPRF